ncbi:enoyl-CoA hydratase-related protein [Bradyrhizobium sp. cf659]|uniref:enoyl-CoA hydratase-related protein n=1 Tax=Bradyrhizobium sp. cf659 TaxID=1761771 RepID=UPI001FCE0D16|nr:enoyl-CoA hydratase-related protein [Bradyrhizobium sp. cf659]
MVFSLRFCQMEAKRGIAPLGGAHFRYLSRAGWGNAIYHLLLCDEFTAQRAREIGLVQEVVPAGQQVARAMEIAAIIARNAPLGIQVTKEAAAKYAEQAKRLRLAHSRHPRSRAQESRRARGHPVLHRTAARGLPGTPRRNPVATGRCGRRNALDAAVRENSLFSDLAAPSER